MLCLALSVVVAVAARHATAIDPIFELRQSREAFEAGNFSAARHHARRAITAEPGWAAAQVALARAAIQLDEGDVAEGALNRAVSAGADRRRLRPLLAEAYLDQGDADRALAETKDLPESSTRALALAAAHDNSGAIAVLDRLIAARPADAGNWIDLARIRFAASDIGGADLAARQAVTLDGNDPAALTLRGELVRTRFGLVAALPWFAAALKHDPHYHPALIEQAATFGDLGRYQDMLRTARRALAIRPDSPQALYLQAMLAARANKIDLARALLARTGGAIDETPSVILLDGALSYAAGDVERAVARLRELVGRQPMNLAARRLLGASLLRSGDPRGALDILRPVAIRMDADSYTLSLVGRAFEATGERDWAARFLDRAQRPALSPPRQFASDGGVGTLAGAVALAPNDPRVLIAYARAQLDEGAANKPMTQAKALIASSPGAPAAHLLAGDIAAIAGRPTDAMAAYAAAADLRFDVPVLLRLTEAAAGAGQPRSAASAIALYLSQNPQSATARRMLANAELGAREWTGARRTLEQLRATLGNRDALMLAQLAYACIEIGEVNAALAYGRAAYRLAPQSPVTADAYGFALDRAGRPADALPLLTKATALAPTDPSLRSHLARARRNAGT